VLLGRKIRRLVRPGRGEYSREVVLPSLATTSVIARKAVAVALVIGVLAVSTSGVLVRLAQAPSLALAFWRCIGGAAALAPFALRSRVRVTAGQWWQLAGSGLMLALHFALYISAVRLTTVASAVLLSTMAPLFVGLGARLLGEPPSRRVWGGIGVATGGTLVIGAADAGLWRIPTFVWGVSPSTLTAPVTEPATVPLAGAPLLGDAMGFGAAAMVAGYFLIGRAARRRLPVSVYGVWVYGIAAVTLLVACLATGARLSGYGLKTWLVIAGLIIGPQLLGHTVFNQLLSTLPATTVAMAILAEPVAAGLLAWLVLQELPPPLFALGAPLVLAGVWLATVPRARVRACPEQGEPSC
jgi:drug/metabolite transporter (DMT)-like permease